ncbi:hypothetical protein B0T10DRAFT_80385 [Thelonectria olida]|uniref:Uncharacterized protein n=1 Tax=Thelonectria olida TaxID=1576542 RepID=A0A9P8W368_9HYPO|nr:hypothetical protein B0T10DRAFT_80385 [Thelonectria olida]
MGWCRFLVFSQFSLIGCHTYTRSSNSDATADGSRELEARSKATIHIGFPNETMESSALEDTIEYFAHDRLLFLGL